MVPFPATFATLVALGPGLNPVDFDFGGEDALDFGEGEGALGGGEVEGGHSAAGGE